MDQLRKLFSGEQTKVLLETYWKGLLRRTEAQGMFRIGKKRFFALIRRYRQDPEAFRVGRRKGYDPEKLDTPLLWG